MKYLSIGLLFFVLSISGTSQTTLKVAFLGNSYTFYNNLPGMIDSIANASGNDLIHQQNTPGGYTLNGHSTNTTSLNLLTADTWDYVVLQDQSQFPSFPYTQVQTDVYPKAKILCDSARSANACVVPVFYNTWGREVGDPQWDSINTFEKMNNRLYIAYNNMAIANSGIVSPVGLAFKAIFDDANAVVSHASLYTADGSHPSIFGSYLAACVFYNTLFNANSVGNVYLPNSISQAEADYLQTIASNVMYMATSPIFDHSYPQALFSFSAVGPNASFTNASLHAFSYLWDFGDNATSTAENPMHTYAQDGTFTVKLTALYCDRVATYELPVTVSFLSNTSENIIHRMYPNPFSDVLFVTTENADDITISDISGRVIYSNHALSKTEQIDLSEQQAGVYFVQVRIAGHVKTKKVIKQ